MSMHTVGETAVPPASMASDFESPARAHRPRLVAGGHRALDSDQPPVPDSKPPLGTRL